MQTDPTIDAVFRALSDPTRRRIFQHLAAGEATTVSDLTAASGVTQGAVSQHLKTLKLAHLVTERPDGRKVYYSAETQGLAPLYDWMAEYGVFWRDSFTAMRDLLKEIDP